MLLALAGRLAGRLAGSPCQEARQLCAGPARRLGEDCRHRPPVKRMQPWRLEAVLEGATLASGQVEEELEAGEAAVRRAAVQASGGWPQARDAAREEPVAGWRRLLS